MIARLLHALVDALAIAGQTMRREPPTRYTGCPYDDVCARCHHANDDGVCTPDERSRLQA